MSEKYVIKITARGDVEDYICGDAVLAQYDGSSLIGFDEGRAQRIVDGLREGGKT